MQVEQVSRDVWAALLTSILIGNPRLKNGFGDLNGEFWLGYDNLQRLTATVDVILRVDLEDFDGNITHAEYIQLRWRTRHMRTGFRLEVTAARLVNL